VHKNRKGALLSRAMADLESSRISEKAAQIVGDIMNGKYGALDDLEYDADKFGGAFSFFDRLSAEQKKRYLIIGGVVLAAAAIGGYVYYKQKKSK
jgi:hypothetical protein